MKKLIAEENETNQNYDLIFETFKIVYKTVPVHHNLSVRYKSIIRLKNVYKFNYEFEKVVEHHKQVLSKR